MVIILAIAAMMVVVTAMLVSVRPHLIPPGPRLLPFLGNLHLLYKKDLRDLLQRFRQIYGNIFSLYLGRRLVVVVSGKWLMREIFVRNANVFSNRPQDFGNERINMNIGILYNNGSIWHQQRRFVAAVFRDLDTRSDMMESCVAPEMINLTCKLIELQQQPFDPSNHLLVTTANVMFSTLLGIHFDSDDPEFTRFFVNLQTAMHHPNFHNLVQSKTWASWIPGSHYKRNTNSALQEADLKAFICRHLKTRLDADDDENGSGTVCFADAYIKKIQLKSPCDTTSPYHVDNLIQIILELMYAGTESTAITLEWTLLYLTLHPQCQDRARDEIDLVLDHAFPSYSDRERLPYLESVILESQRLADINPFSMLHLSTADIVIEGLTIPSNTIMVPNMTSMLYDPKLFPRPDEFRPERFLNDKRTSLKDTILNPFFSGKRSCLCENLARMEIFLFITAMLQHFKFALPEDTPPPSLQGVFEDRRRPAPFKIIAIRRQF